MLRLLTMLAALSAVCAYAAPPVYQEPTQAQTQIISDQARDQLGAADAYANSPAFQKRLSESQQGMGRVTTQLPTGNISIPVDSLAEKWSSIMKDAEARSAKHASAAPALPGPIIFVSLSMPRESLTLLATDAAKAGGVAVFRGLKDNSFMAMRRALTGLGQGFEIDPTKFSRFGVDQVPSLVLPLEPIVPCTANGCPPIRYVKVSGNVTVEAALDYITTSSTDPQARALAQQLLDRIRKS